MLQAIPYGNYGTFYCNTRKMIMKRRMSIEKACTRELKFALLTWNRMQTHACTVMMMIHFCLRLRNMMLQNRVRVTEKTHVYHVTNETI